VPAFERELLSSLNLRKAVGELAGRRVHFNQTDPKRRWAVARQLGLRVAAKRPSRTRATLKGAALATLGALYEAIAARTGAKLSEVTEAGTTPALPGGEGQATHTPTARSPTTRSRSRWRTRRRRRATCSRG